MPARTCALPPDGTPDPPSCPPPPRSYCGIRNNQKQVYRYTMPEEEVVEVAKWALENGIRNIMLQVGGGGGRGG